MPPDYDVFYDSERNLINEPNNNLRSVHTLDIYVECESVLCHSIPCYVEMIVAE